MLTWEVGLGYSRYVLVDGGDGNGARGHDGMFMTGVCGMSMVRFGKLRSSE